MAHLVFLGINLSENILLLKLNKILQKNPAVSQCPPDILCTVDCKRKVLDDNSGI